MALLQNIIGVVALVVAILTIYDVWAVNKKDSTGMKVVWTVLAVIFSIITGIVYYLIRKR
jgi:cytochrome c oxidase assembly factor CtaG